MPTFLTDCRIDWDWPARTDGERAVIERYQPQLDDRDHTLETFAAQLGAASAELRGVAIAALVDDQAETRVLVLARDGAVTKVPVKDATRRYSITLGQDDKVRALLAADKSALFPATVSALDRLAAGESKISHALFFPEPMLDFVQREATRTDRSLSWIVQFAWKHAHESIAALPDRDAANGLRPSYAAAATVKQTLYVATEMLAAAEAEAARFGSSLSWLLQLAIAIATPAITALPERSVV